MFQVVKLEEANLPDGNEGRLLGLVHLFYFTGFLAICAFCSASSESLTKPHFPSAPFSNSQKTYHF
jgi:hypothetical protein